MLESSSYYIAQYTIPSSIYIYAVMNRVTARIGSTAGEALARRDPTIRNRQDCWSSSRLFIAVVLQLAGSVSDSATTAHEHLNGE